MKNTIKFGLDDGFSEVPTFLRDLQSSHSEQEEKKMLEVIQEDEYEINVDSLKKLYVLGKGAFGEVSVYLDLKTGVRYARKILSKLDDFLEEKRIIQDLMKRAGAQFELFGAPLEKYDNKTKTLYYKCGECSLDELMKVRAQNSVWWWDSQGELVFVMKQILNCFKVMFELGMYHTDLKPANIICLKKKDERNVTYYNLQLVDFGSATTDFNEVKSLTKEYYVDINAKLPFKSKEERIKAENYTLGRTMMRIMLMSVCVKEQTPLDYYFENNPVKILEALEKLESYYAPEILNVVRMLIEEVDMNLIEEELTKLEETPIKDNKNLIPKILEMKQQKEMTEINEENFESEFQICMSQNMAQRALDMANYLGPKLEENINFVNLKVEAMKKLGMFSEAQNFTKAMFIIHGKLKIEDYPDLKTKWNIILFNLYYSWTQPIHRGRYERMEEFTKMIQETFGEISKEMGFIQFWQGWLNVGDGRNDQSRYPIAEGHFKKAEEIYEKVLGHKECLELAETYRYWAQLLYHQKKTDECIKLYELEKEIRAKIQGENSSDMAVVLNSLANCYGNLQGDLQKGYQIIGQCLEIYQNTIGEKNQNFCIALDWKAWYSNKLKKYDDAAVLWEKGALLSYQIFGGNYYIHTNIVDANMLELYKNQFDILDRVQKAFMEPMEEQIQVENYQLAKDYHHLASHMFEKVKPTMSYGYKVSQYDPQLIAKIRWKLDYREKFIDLKLSTQNSVSIIDQIDNLKHQEENIPPEFVQERSTNVIRRLVLMQKLNTDPQEIEKEYQKYIQETKDLEQKLKETTDEEFQTIYSNFYQTKFQALEQIQDSIINLKCQYIMFLIKVLENSPAQKNDQEDDISLQIAKIDSEIEMLQLQSKNQQQKSQTETLYRSQFMTKFNIFRQRKQVTQAKQMLANQLLQLRRQLQPNTLRFVDILLEMANMYKRVSANSEADKLYQEAKQITLKMNLPELNKTVQNKIQDHLKAKKQALLEKLNIQKGDIKDHLNKTKQTVETTHNCKTENVELEFQPLQLKNFSSSIYMKERLGLTSKLSTQIRSKTEATDQ